MKLRACLIVLALSSHAVAAQTPSRQKIGLTQYLQSGHAGITRMLVEAAEKMPDGDYGFKPTDMSEARAYGAVIAHAADGMFGACARATGMPNPRPNVEKTLTNKTDIVKALKDAVAFCDGAFSGLTARSAEDYVPQGPVDIPRTAALMGVLAHNAEMFGISTVYLRAKNIVPPGSEGR